MNLMKQIHDYPVDRNSVAMWWLGQSGYIFKSPEGTTVGVDLYLTDSVAKLEVGLDLRRRIPILLSPEDVQIDVFACSHNHQDHTDPETIRALRNKDTTSFLGPMPSCEVFGAEGVEKARIVPAWPKSEYEFRDFRMVGTFALPTDDSDLNHMGFIFQFGHGPKIYFTGDTDFHELLGAAAKHKPELMITCINGGYNNLSHWEAARLASMIKPQVAIPCHYDMFSDNSIDPRQFRAALTLQSPDVSYVQLKHGEPFIFSV